MSDEKLILGLLGLVSIGGIWFGLTIFKPSVFRTEGYQNCIADAVEAKSLSSEVSQICRQLR